MRFYIVLMLVLAGPVSANEFWRWDADAYTTPVVNDTTVTACDASITSRTSIDTGEKHEGTGSMKYVIVGSEQEDLGCKLTNPFVLSPAVEWEGGTTLYSRFWMKIDSGFDWGTVFKKMKTERWNESGGDGSGTTNYLNVGSVDVSECAECNPIGSGDGRLTADYDFDPVTNSAVSDWQEYIFAFTMQSGETTQDATLALYVNGVKVDEDLTAMRVRDCTGGCADMQIAFGPIGAFFFPQLCSEGVPCDARGGADAGGTIWVDDFNLSDTFNSNFEGDSPPSPSATGVVLSGGVSIQ